MRIAFMLIVLSASAAAAEGPPALKPALLLKIEPMPVVHKEEGRKAAEAAAAKKSGPAAGKIVRVIAIDRDVPQEAIQKEVKVKTYPARSWNGVYVWDRLPNGTYDIQIETANGKFEGVDLRSEAESDKPLTEADRKKIRKKFTAMKTWSDQKRMLKLTGDGEEAVALVELLRTKKTSLKAREPFVVWRVESWRFRKLYGVWRRDDGAAVLRRFRVNRAEFAGWKWNFLPELGGVDIEAGSPSVVKTVRLPPSFSADRGRAGQPIVSIAADPQHVR